MGTPGGTPQSLCSPRVKPNGENGSHCGISRIVTSTDLPLTQISRVAGHSVHKSLSGAYLYIVTVKNVKMHLLTFWLQVISFVVISCGGENGPSELANLYCNVCLSLCRT